MASGLKRRRVVEVEVSEGSTVDIFLHSLIYCLFIYPTECPGRLLCMYASMIIFCTHVNCLNPLMTILRDLRRHSKLVILENVERERGTSCCFCDLFPPIKCVCDCTSIPVRV